MHDDDDHIDRLVAQWAQERPDLDAGVMAESARLVLIGRLLEEANARRAAAAGVDLPQADVLLTLRRAGPPFRLSPTELAQRTLVTTGTMTNRLNRLEARGLIRRLRNPDDGRGLVVELTDEARELVDALVPGHVDALQELFGGLTQDERAQLVAITRKLLRLLQGR